MPLKPYEEFAPEPLAFPIGSKLYVLPPLDYRLGLRLQQILAGDDDSLNDAKGEDLFQLVLGPLWDEMKADGVPLEAMQRAGFVALADYQYGRAMAEKVWENGLDPEALAAALTAAASTGRKQPADRKTRSTPTAGAARTRSRASGSGTKTSPPS